MLVRNATASLSKLTMPPVKAIVCSRKVPTRHRARRADAFCSPRGGLVLGGSGSSAAHSGGMPPSGIAYAC